MLEGKSLAQQEPIRRYLVSAIDQGYTWKFALRTNYVPHLDRTPQDAIILPCLVYKRVGKIDGGYAYEYQGADI